MISKLIEWSATNRFVIGLFTVFAVAWGVWALRHTPLDAIPDLSDVQVIIQTEWAERSPTLVEDQITYPIVVALLSAPKVKVVRGFSFFGLSFVYAIFEDGTDLYWARSRVLEYLQGVKERLPQGVTPILGPDATGVGWGFEYAIMDETGRHDLAQLRTVNDWYVHHWLQSVPGVAEVARVGGFVKQYQVSIDPTTLLGYKLSLDRVVEAIRKGNNDTGGRVVEFSGREYMVRGLGYIRSLKDLEAIVVGTDDHGTPILVRDIGRVGLGPDIRRGVAELDGEGDVAGGIAVIRYGENALDVIQRIKEKIKTITPSLPEGVKIIATYDRSDLIHRSIATLKEKLIEESIIVSLVSILFLFHFRSALVAILTLPIAILMSFITMYYIGLGSNIMSLGGIAIAIGAMIDAAIVMIENAHKRLEHAAPGSDRNRIIIEAAKEVGKPLFYSLLIITVSFIPVFTLQAQEGRLFRPLAFTKTFAMFFSSLLSVTLVPLLMVLLIRGKIHSEQKNPISRFLIWVYNPIVHAVLRWRKATIAVAFLSLLATIPDFMKLGSEFMPPLYEGTLLYMPTALPGASITQVSQLLQIQDRIVKHFPEVESVFAKGGRSTSATDPAPLEMIETVINLKPEAQWRRGMTVEKLIDELDKALQVPGVTNAWTMPIKGRTDMLSTGIRTPIGIKVLGPKLETIQRIGQEIEASLKPVAGTRSVLAERVAGGYYLDFEIKRDEIARYGLTVTDVEDVIETAIGGSTVTTTIEGRERFPVNVRYFRGFRDSLEGLKRVLVSTPMGQQVPITQLVDLKLSSGTTLIRSEAAELVGYVYVDVVNRDIGGYVAEAQRVVAEKVKLPQGYHLLWSGQFEYMERAKERLKYVIPLTLLIIFVLLYFNFGSLAKCLIVLLSVPFSLVGGIWLLYLLGYNLSVAVWVGIIALAGVAAETGVVMIVYLDEVYERRVREGKMASARDLYEAIIEGAVMRVRPKMMTVMAIMAGLLPIMWSHGAGADVMKRIAAPMIGGMVTSTILTLVIIPVIYEMWRSRQLTRTAILQTPHEREP
ncbi:CusA/CzcA family heavy metal efflux RND transporter [Candidatus Methylomirabilis sp.]|uniref:efflux RND transporter permease subunit n=1 Tax=Candidatus Methylomirabilis sp. TaxID=2032687 RepID=UPI002A688B26|nr:CusA/CzcA family heavy metal efflux RND transporter [Candidatus Methylomirabilis sp.]